jgi:hypothetical protein
MQVAVALRKIASRQWGFVPACLRTRKHSQLSASVLAAALYAVMLAGCAPDHGGSTSPGYTGRHPTVSAKVFRPAKVSRTAKVSDTAKVSGPAIPVTRSDSRPPIPLPDQELLIPQPEPDCEFKPQPQPSQIDPNTERMKLDYERQCYRHAEIIVRRRLQLLQASVGEMLKAAILGNMRTETPKEVQ